MLGFNFTEGIYLHEPGSKITYSYKYLQFGFFHTVVLLSLISIMTVKHNNQEQPTIHRKKLA